MLCCGHMYIRTTTRINKNGSRVEYVQLAHNFRDPKTGQTRAEVLYNFGRPGEIDQQALRRLVRSIGQLMSPEDALQNEVELKKSEPLKFVGSRKLGGVWVLQGLWEKLGVGQIIRKQLQERQYKIPVERALFAMVANRALDPASKLSIEEWVAHDVVVTDLNKVEVHQLYRAMDFVLESANDLQEQVFWSVANLLNLEVDLIFFDTTTAYFETRDEDPTIDDRVGFRKRGKNKDGHDELPQIVIGFAVTRSGIPVRCWSWRGNTSDMTVVDEVKRDLIGWKLGRVITVMDRGFSSEENLRILQRAGGHYIVGEKMRSGKATVEDALARPGRFKKVKENLEVKEIVVGDGEARKRYVLAYNPSAAERDRQVRQDILQELSVRLEKIDQSKSKEHSKSLCKLRSHPTFGKFLLDGDNGTLRINQDKVKEEEKLDGKFLILTSDDTLSVEDVALGYKQLFEVERAFKDLKHVLDIRPMYHRLEDRIKAHVLLCWLALLLIRVVETETNKTWRELRKGLDRLVLGEFVDADGSTVAHASEISPQQKQIFDALKLAEPKAFWKIELATPAKV